MKPVSEAWRCICCAEPTGAEGRWRCRNCRLCRLGQRYYGPTCPRHVAHLAAVSLPARRPTRKPRVAAAPEPTLYEIRDRAGAVISPAPGGFEVALRVLRHWREKHPRAVVALFRIADGVRLTEWPAPRVLEAAA